MNQFPLLLLLLLLLLSSPGVSTKMKLSPETLTVLRGDEARFTCTTSDPDWRAMVWLLNGTMAVTISRIHGVISSSGLNMTAEEVVTSRDGGWVFVLKDTQRFHQGSVTCDLGGSSRETAQLFVQEKGSVYVSGSQKMAFKGQEVQFQCRASGWFPRPLITWHVNHRKVSRSDYNISGDESEKNVFTVTSDLTVTAAKSSEVDCLASVSALLTPASSSVRLVVVAEVLQDESDCWPLTLTASLASLLLLLAVCGVSAVFACRRRRNSKAAEPPVLRFRQSEDVESPAAEVTTGTINLGYSGESSTDAVYDELVKVMQRRMDFINHDQVPDLVHSGPEIQTQENLVPEKNVRRMTTV